ncbi:MAG: hypothetical protein ACI3YC_01995, partial [Alloprevotella sp.]
MLTRFYILLLALCLGLSAAAAPQMPTLSDESNEYWYYIQFDRSQGNYGNTDFLKHHPLVGYNGATPAEGTELYATQISLVEDNMWKVEQGSASNSYKLYNKKSGLYLSYSGGVYKLSATATEIMLPESTNSSFSDSYEICVATLTLGEDGVTYTASAQAGTYMNPNGGSLAGKKLAGYSQGDGGNYLSFVPVNLSDANLTYSYYHFSNMGRGILYDDGTATDATPAPATVKKGGEVEEADLGYKWALYMKVLLVSDRGNFLTLDGNQVKVITPGSSAERLQVLSNANTYNGSVTRTELLFRNELDYGLGYDYDPTLTKQIITKQKADSRFSCLKAYSTYTELTEGIARHPDAVPLISNSTANHYYRISLRDKYFNSTISGANITAVAKTSDVTPQSTWKLVDDGSGLGEYYIITQYGHYFKWDGTNYVLTLNR